MIIALPADENKTDICPSFARCPYFVFHNTETNSSETLENSFASAQGGAGIKSAQFLVDKGAKAVITPRCGENAAKVLKAANVAIYKANGVSLTENLKELSDKKLNPLEQFHAGYHGIK